MIGVLPAIVAAIGFALFQLVNGRALAGVDVYRGTATLLGVGALVLAAISLVTQDLRLLTAAPLASFLFVSAAGFVHFFCGWTFLGIAQVQLGVARAGILIATVPLFGAVLAAVFLDEALTVPMVVGLFAVVGGISLVVRARAGGRVTGTGSTGGVLAGLATALCWASSPILIRLGLEELPSPILGATVGLITSASVYVLAMAVTGRRVQRARVDASTRRLMVLGGVLVSLSIWMQWTAFDLARVATVLALLQLTPVVVLLVSMRLAGGDIAVGRTPLVGGATLTVAGSLVIVLLG